jgi:hypothetical protein
LPPAGEISRYSPRSSKRRMGFVLGLALRIAVSVRGTGSRLWGQQDFWNRVLPHNVAPTCLKMSMNDNEHCRTSYSPYLTCFQVVLDSIGRCRMRVW